MTTPYTLPEPRHWYATNGIAIGYHSDQMQAAFAAGAASRDAKVEALTLALQTERAAANRLAKDTVHWIEKHDKLLAEIEALRADADRYQWLTVNAYVGIAPYPKPHEVWCLRLPNPNGCANLHAAIDAAIAAQGGAE